MSDAVELFIEPRERDIGGGAKVRRLLPFRKRRMVGPFTFFDTWGPVTVPAGAGSDVLPHPHVHLATVSYFFEGQTTHRDSLGTVARVEPGDVGWMNAGRGIVHSERTPEDVRGVERGSHGIQAWVALPDAEEDSEPTFQHVPASGVPEDERDGLRLRLLAGEAFGLRSPVEVKSPLFYAEVAGTSGGAIAVDVELGERAVFAVSGEMRVAGESLAERSMAVLRDGVPVEVHLEAGAVAMLLGGAPVGPRFMFWNFVASSKERLEAAAERWRALDFPLIPDDRDEHVPLPE